MKSNLKFFLNISLCIIIFSCIAPHSRFYKPVSQWEESEFKIASRQIYPEDVRYNINKYIDSTVVWPGIIKEYEIINHDDRIELKFLLEHHYYDWIEDFSIQRAKIFLSPRGEGLFRTSWYLKKSSNIDDIKKHSEPENLAIVYGKPQEVLNDSSIVIKCTYFRGIERQWYRTDVMDYGRNGENAKLLNIPMY